MKKVSAIIAGVFFVVAGCNHFYMPEFYLRIIPPFLPAQEWINWISGVAEILLGAMMFFPVTRKPASWGLIALLIAVFPANIYAAITGGAAMDTTPFVAWARLPFQFLFIAWMYWHTKD